MKKHDVARDERGCREVLDAAVPPDLGMRRGGVPQGLEGVLAPVLGRHVRADEGNESGQDEQSVPDLSDDGGGDARAQQHEQERLRRGTQRQSPDLRWIRGGQLVRAGLGGALLRVTRR